MPEPLTPTNLDAEAAVLGACLSDRDAIVAIAPSLETEHFYLERHRWIYAAMLALYERRVPCDLITVGDELRRAGHLEECGDTPGLAMLADSTPIAQHVEYYATIVRDVALSRAMIEVGRAIAAAGYTTPDRDALVKQASDLLERTTRQSQTSRLLTAEQASRLWQEHFSADRPVGQPTGIRTLDKHLIGGLHRGDLVILAARPSIGKTALALQIARNIAMTGDLVLYVSLEMKAVPSLWQRLLAVESGINSERIRMGQAGIGEGEMVGLMEADGRLSEATLMIDDDFSGSAFDIRTRALALQAERGRVSLVVVDYLQLVNGGGDPNRKQDARNRVLEIGEISRSLKHLAGALDCPVLALSQLNRGVESRADRTPLLSDLRESGNLEQDADLVWFLKAPDDGTKNVCEVHIAKHRNGPLGKVALWFAPETGRWSDLEVYRSPQGY